MNILDRLDEAEREATAAPWGLTPAAEDMVAYLDPEEWDRGPTWLTGPSFVDLDDYGSWFPAADAALIALSRNHLRALIDVARAAQEFPLVPDVPGWKGPAPVWAPWLRRLDRALALLRLDRALAPLLAEDDGQTLSSGYAMDAQAREWAREAEDET